MWRIDSTLDALGDLINAFYKAAFNPNADAKKAELEKFTNELFPTWADRMEKRLKENTNPLYFVGESWTIADFAIGAYAFTSWENEASEGHAVLKAIIDKHPLLTAYTAHAKEASKDYLAARKVCPW
jgi:glutathione S-transferase